MSGSYWKFAGEKIALGAGRKTLARLGLGAKMLGRAGTVAGIGFLAYEFFKSYKNNIEKEPAYGEMVILQTELEKWTSAISCLGSEAFKEREYGSFEEGGALNALYRKKAISGDGVRAADPKEAYTLIGRSMNYIRQTENLLDDARFKKYKKELIANLRKLQLQIDKTDDYRPIQTKLDRIVAQIRPIAAGYARRVSDCNREIQKTLGANAAWAAVSTASLGLVKKPLHRQA